MNRLPGVCVLALGRESAKPGADERRPDSGADGPIVLTVIAACLLGLLLRDAPTITTVRAFDNTVQQVWIKGADPGARLPVVNASGNGGMIPFVSQVTNSENGGVPIPLSAYNPVSLPSGSPVPFVTKTEK